MCACMYVYIIIIFNIIINNGWEVYMPDIPPAQEVYVDTLPLIYIIYI